jgi:hypothetical protein
MANTWWKYPRYEKVAIKLNVQLQSAVQSIGVNSVSVLVVSAVFHHIPHYFSSVWAAVLFSN